MRSATAAWALAALLASGACAAQPGAVIAPRVLVVNLFDFEATPWREAMAPTRDLRIAGLDPANPVVRCTADDVCQVTTGMGHANAAATMTAVLFSPELDLRSSYLLIAGIAGIAPEAGTLGTVAWARFAIDGGLTHEVDARERPAGWDDGFLGIMADSPGQRPRLEYGTERFELDGALLERALALSQGVALEDSDDARAYRAHYREPAARERPRVTQCDTYSGDTWWAGRYLAAHAERWTRLLTDGRGRYCTTQQEDNALLTVIARAAQAGRADRARVAILRAGSDFDRPYPGQSAIDSLRAQRQLEGAAQAAVVNLVRAGLPLVVEIRDHWEAWRTGVPPR